jgi:membrane protease YdiL (CAAX protease family)
VSTSDKEISLSPSESPSEPIFQFEQSNDDGDLRPPPSPSSSKSRDVVAAIGLWLLSILSLTLLPALVALPYVFIRYPNTKDVGQLLSSDPTIIFLTILGVLPAHVITFGGAWAIVTQFGRRPFWQSLGKGWGKGWSNGAGLAICVVLAIGLYLIGVVLAKVLGGDAQTDIEILLKSSTATRITLAILAVATAPLVEEVVYRGVIYNAFERAVGTPATIFVVSFLFTLVHVFQYRNNWGVIAVIALLSVSLTIVRAVTGRVLPCIIIHTIFNGIQSLIILFYPLIEQMQKQLEQKLGAGFILTALGFPFFQHVI